MSQPPTCPICGEGFSGMTPAGDNLQLEPCGHTVPAEPLLKELPVDYVPEDIAAREEADRATRMMSEIPGPPSTTEPVMVQLVFQDGQAYAAPAGSTLAVPDAWIRVQSLTDLAERVGVEFEP